jgi:phosphatidylglycerophosphate synthase
LKLARVPPAQLAAPAAPSPLNVANAITVAGFAAGVAWWAGAGAGFGVLSIVADELDGRIARATNTTTELGSLLDWSSDVVLTTLALERLDAPTWTIPAATVGQTYLRSRNIRPPIGSLRALLMLVAMARDRELL